MAEPKAKKAGEEEEKEVFDLSRFSGEDLDRLRAFANPSSREPEEVDPIEVAKRYFAAGGTIPEVKGFWRGAFDASLEAIREATSITEADLMQVDMAQEPEIQRLLQIAQDQRARGDDWAAFWTLREADAKRIFRATAPIQIAAQKVIGAFDVPAAAIRGGLSGARGIPGKVVDVLGMRLENPVMTYMQDAMEESPFFSASTGKGLLKDLVVYGPLGIPGRAAFARSAKLALGTKAAKSFQLVTKKTPSVGKGPIWGVRTYELSPAMHARLSTEAAVEQAFGVNTFLDFERRAGMPSAKRAQIALAEEMAEPFEAAQRLRETIEVGADKYSAPIRIPDTEWPENLGEILRNPRKGRARRLVAHKQADAETAVALAKSADKAVAKGKRVKAVVQEAEGVEEVLAVRGADVPVGLERAVKATPKGKAGPEAASATQKPVKRTPGAKAGLPEKPPPAVIRTIPLSELEKGAPAKPIKPPVKPDLPVKGPVKRASVEASRAKAIAELEPIGREVDTLANQLEGLYRQRNARMPIAGKKGAVQTNLDRVMMEIAKAQDKMDKLLLKAKGLRTAADNAHKVDAVGILDRIIAVGKGAAREGPPAPRAGREIAEILLSRREARKIAKSPKAVEQLAKETAESVATETPTPAAKPGAAIPEGEVVSAKEASAKAPVRARLITRKEQAEAKLRDLQQKATKLVPGEEEALGKMYTEAAEELEAAEDALSAWEARHGERGAILNPFSLWGGKRAQQPPMKSMTPFQNVIASGGDALVERMKGLYRRFKTGKAPLDMVRMEDEIKADFGHLQSLSERIASKTISGQERDILGKRLASVKVKITDAVAVYNAYKNNLQNLHNAYFGDPETLLRASLGDEGRAWYETLELSERKYRKELSKLTDDIDSLFQKHGIVRGSDGDKRIFNALNGDIQMATLSGGERQIAELVRHALDDIADRLGLPQESRNKNYITHLYQGAGDRLYYDTFDSFGVSKPPEKVFLRYMIKRGGGDPDALVRSASEALDAYLRPALAKIHFDPILDDFAKRFANKIDFDKALTELDESGRLPDMPGIYGESIQVYANDLVMAAMGRRTSMSKNYETWLRTHVPGFQYFTGDEIRAANRLIAGVIYQGTLGLNFRSALVNLFQNINTFAKVSPGGFMEGLTGAFRKKGYEALLDEVGIQDHLVSEGLSKKIGAPPGRKFLEWEHKAMFSMFSATEKFNRRVAAIAGYHDALRMGMKHDAAIKHARQVVKDTQFSFARHDVPGVFNVPEAKLFTMFLRFPIGQARFIKEMAKNKRYGEMFKYAVATGAVMQGFASMLDVDTERYQGWLGIKPAVPALPPIPTAVARVAGQTFEPEIAMKIAAEEGRKMLPLLVPGGAQIRRSMFQGKGLVGLPEVEE